MSILKIFKTEFFLAWRYLRPKRNAVSVITCISVVGVMLGVGVLIVVLAVMTGFTDEMKEKLLETTAHMQIFDFRNGCIRDTAEVMRKVEEAGCRGAPVVGRPGLLQKDKRLVPKEVIGIDPAHLDDGIQVSKYISAGRFSLEKGKILVGDVTAHELGLQVGDKIVIHSPEKIAQMVKYDGKGKVDLASTSKVYLPDEYEISGTFLFGKYDFDSSIVFMNMDDAGELFNLPWGAATSIYVRTPDPFHLDSELRALRDKLPDLKIYSWKQMNSQFLGVLAVEKNMMFFLLVFIVLVAAFSISNTLITVVMQKTREIGLLKAIGADSGTVMRIFVLQGFLVGVAGTFCGIALGVAVIALRSQILLAIRSLTGMEIFPRKFYFFSELPASIRLSDIVIIAVVSVALCTLGALIPAFRASRLDPAKALRYE